MKPKTHLDWAEAFAKVLLKYLKEDLNSLVVYGSAATGKEKPESDIDLLLVINGISGGRYLRRKILDPIYQEWDRLHRDQPIPFISTILLNPQEVHRSSPLFFDMADRHRVLIDRDDLMKKILSDWRARLKKLGARRLKLGKVEYWDLKPDYRPGDVFEI